jgi:hypothetical protein
MTSRHIFPPGRTQSGFESSLRVFGTEIRKLDRERIRFSGKQYDLSLWNSGQIASVEGGKFIQEESGQGRIRVELPGTDLYSYVHAKILIHFVVGARKQIAKPAKSAD